MTSHRIAVAAALGVAALGLVGAGAGAQFTDAVTVKQHITAGTLDLQLSSTAGGSAVTGGGKRLAFGGWGPTQSTFTTGAQQLKLTNAGNINAHSVTVAVAASPAGGDAGSALASQVCMRLTAAGGTVYDGPLSSMAPVSAALTIPAGQSITGTVAFYAGSGSCPSLSDAAQGGSITPTLTATISD